MIGYPRPDYDNSNDDPGDHETGQNVAVIVIPFAEVEVAFLKIVFGIGHDAATHFLEAGLRMKVPAGPDERPWAKSNP